MVRATGRGPEMEVFSLALFEEIWSRQGGSDPVVYTLDSGIDVGLGLRIWSESRAPLAMGRRHNKKRQL